MARFKPFNEYKIIDGECQFYIVNKKKEKFTILVDEDILKRLIKHNQPWHIKWAGWAYYVCWCEYLGSLDGKVKYKIHYLHRWIMNAKEDEYVDHKEAENTLDNRRSNLRVTTNSENTKNKKSKNINNKSGYRNVSWNGNTWSVQLQIEGVNTTLKRFPKDQLEEAGKYAEKMRKELYGEFAGKS